MVYKYPKIVGVGVASLVSPIPALCMIMLAVVWHDVSLLLPFYVPV